MNINKTQLNIVAVALFLAISIFPSNKVEAKSIGFFSGIFGGGTGDDITDLGDATDLSGFDYGDPVWDDPIGDLGDPTDLSGGTDIGPEEDDDVPILDDEGTGGTDVDGDGEDDIDEWVDAPTSTSFAVYCGDGVVNQSWEMCDGGSSCTDQCQSSNVCTDKGFAKVTIDSASNIAPGDVRSDVYLADNSLPIPSGAWFLIHDGENFVDDPFSESVYKPWRGIVVERQGSTTKVMLPSFGLTEGTGYEHVDGKIDYFNISPSSITNDTSGDNAVENMDNGTEEYNASEDEVDLNDNVDFWLTIGHKDDAFFVKYDNAPKECVTNDDDDQYDPTDVGGDEYDGDDEDEDDNDNDDDDDGDDEDEDDDEDGEVLGAFTGPDATLAQTGFDSTIIIALAIITLLSVLYIQSRRKIPELNTIKF